MSNLNVVSLVSNLSVRGQRRAIGKVMLVKPPYFTPWTPPLGIAILKSFLEQHGFYAKCFDFNIDPELWGMHHKYFATLQALEDVSINDGYSKLWWILNAHMLAYANGASPAQCARVLETVIPLYSIRCDRDTINALIPLVEGFFRRLGELTDQVDWSEYSVVGTSTYTTSLSSSLFILKRVKEKYPHVTTVMGGGVFADDLALGSDNLNTLAEQYSYVDHAVLGEGELLFLKLLEGEFADKKVITLSDLEGASLEMSDVPIPDFSDLSNEMYYHLSIEGARSCPFQCSFCSETIQWGEYRKKPTNLFAEQVIELSEKYNNNAFFMGDSLMNPYINPFAGELINRKANILYDGYLRADKPVTNRGFVKMWAQSGLFRVRLGIESAATRVLEAMDKMTTPKVISEVLKTLANEGIRTTTYWIVGFPGETEEDFQETYQFIQEHHRYIYELEAHPYYYYPYGQVGSRLYECRSLYPDYVTDIIKFRVWDIIDANPTREERYTRLRRISELASDLGLPNIYSMAERYQAEERWQTLHPLAVEAYDGARLEAKEVRLPDHPLESPYGIWKREEAIGSPRASVYCFQASVNEKLDEKVLSASINELVRNSDVLQMDMRDGKYVPPPSAEKLEEHAFVTVYDCEEGGEEIDALREKIIAGLASQMRPERGASIRAAVINRNEQSSDLLLLVHRLLVDAKSVTLLFEDLYRVFKQLSNARPVSPLPVKKTLSEFLKELQAKSSPDVPSDNIESSKNTGAVSLSKNSVDRGGWQLATIDVGESLTARLKSSIAANNDLRAREIVAAALISSLAKSEFDLAVDMTFDCRDDDADLARAVGDLTAIDRLPSSIFQNETMKQNLLETLAAIRRTPVIHSGLDGARTESNSEAARKVLLCMEYFIEEPWLDEPSWAARGFVAEEGGLSGDYLLKALPVSVERRIEVRLVFRDGGDAARLATEIANHLSGEIEAILTHYERFNSAKRYWLDEFSKSVPDTNIGISTNAYARTRPAREFTECEVERPVLQDLMSACGAEFSAVGLAAFSVMISHLSGSQDFLILASADKGEKAVVAPIRIRPFWDLKFTDFVKQIEKKLASGIEHEEYAIDILANDLRGSNENFAPPAFTIGYAFSPAQCDANETALRDWLKLFGGAEKEFELILRVAEASGNARLELVYCAGRTEGELIKKLSSYLSAILREASANPETAAGEIGVARHDAEYAVAADANETFDF